MPYLRARYESFVKEVSCQRSHNVVRQVAYPCVVFYSVTAYIEKKQNIVVLIPFELKNGSTSR